MTQRDVDKNVFARPAQAIAYRSSETLICALGREAAKPDEKSKIHFEFETKKVRSWSVQARRKQVVVVVEFVAFFTCEIYSVTGTLHREVNIAEQLV